MPISALTVQQIARAGITPSYSAGNADGGHSVVNNGATFLHVKNSGVESTMTVVTTASVDGLAVADLTVTIPANTGDKMVGPFSRGTFGDSLTVTFTSVAGITLGAFTM